MGIVLYHVTASANRASIEQHGLDWRHMGAVGGVAGNATGVRTPEREGIFLVEDMWGADWFVDMGLSVGLESLDIWEVSLDIDADLSELDHDSVLPEPLIVGDEGFLCHLAPIPSDRIRLHSSDRTSSSLAD